MTATIDLRPTGQRVTAQPYDVDDEAVEQCLVFVEAVQQLSPRPPGLFGPALPVTPGSAAARSPHRPKRQGPGLGARCRG